MRYEFEAFCQRFPCGSAASDCQTWRVITLALTIHLTEGLDLKFLSPTDSWGREINVVTHASHVLSVLACIRLRPLIAIERGEACTYIVISGFENLISIKQSFVRVDSLEVRCKHPNIDHEWL